MENVGVGVNDPDSNNFAIVFETFVDDNTDSYSCSYISMNNTDKCKALPCHISMVKNNNTKSVRVYFINLYKKNESLTCADFLTNRITFTSTQIVINIVYE